MDSPDAEAMIPPMNATRSDKAIAFSDGVQQPPGKTTHVNVIQVFPLVMEHSTSPLGTMDHQRPVRSLSSVRVRAARAGCTFRRHSAPSPLRGISAERRPCRARAGPAFSPLRSGQAEAAPLSTAGACPVGVSRLRTT